MLSSAGWCWRQGVHCQHQAHRPLQSGRGCSAPWRVHAQPGLIDMLERHQGEVEEVANLIRDISSKLPVTRDWAMLKSSMSSMSQSYARAPLQRASTSTTGPGNAATWDWQASIRWYLLVGSAALQSLPPACHTSSSQEALRGLRKPTPTHSGLCSLPNHSTCSRYRLLRSFPWQEVSQLTILGLGSLGGWLEQLHGCRNPSSQPTTI
jgi:hypothetical protein